MWILSMGEYYFDIETYSPGERPNPDTDKIISIQYQRIDLKTGKPRSDLNILKEWESSEEQIVTEFYNMFFRDGLSVWNFIPVGYSLVFEYEFLISKFEKYLNKKLTSRELHYSRPSLDLKPLVVLMNNSEFKGARLDKFTDKQYDGKKIRTMYENQEYEGIERYIQDEALSFLKLLQKIISNIKNLSI